MQRVKGVYDGTSVRLLEPVSIAPDTPVEVLIPHTDKTHDYWQRLLESGLVKNVHPHYVRHYPFEPIEIAAPPLSQTIIEERR